MPVNDPIADLLTRVRNAAHAKHERAVVPYSRICEAVANVMSKEGFVGNIETVGEGWRRQILIEIRYTDEGKPVFHNLQRESKLGRRKYIQAHEIRPNRQGIGVAVLSTSKGVLKDVDAKRHGVGGEVLCSIW